MAKFERTREALRGPLDLEYIQRKAAAGWRLVALEWERESSSVETDTPRRLEEPPYGLRIADDCQHLEENPEEMKILQTMMELIVQDISMPRMADEMNRRGLSMRDGSPWSPLTIFNIFPRLIEVTPRIFSGETWSDRRPQLSRVTWNS